MSRDLVIANWHVLRLLDRFIYLWLSLRNRLENRLDDNDTLRLSDVRHGSTISSQIVGRYLSQ
jgi:hypothetical protein